MQGIVGEIRRRAESNGVPVKIVPRQEIDRIARDLNHQGVVATTARFRYTPLDDVLVPGDALVLFLDGVTDPHNVGSLIRSADGAGFHGVVVPSKRAAGVTPTVRKVSAGATEVVPVARVTNLGQALDQAKQAGLWVVGLDEKADSDLWSSELLEPPLALVLGAEGKGLSPGVRSHCDGLVSIPSKGKISSLNVGVAGAIAMFEIARRRVGSANL